MANAANGNGSANSHETNIGSLFWPTSWTVEDIQPALYIYRQERPALKIPHELCAKDVAKLLDHNHYLTAERLIFVTHGFRNNIETPWMNEIKDALLKESDQTVILLGWGNGADLYPIQYLQAAANIQSVSDWLAERLTEINKLKAEMQICGVGHSLGAHLMGMAGRKSGVFHRISALDPAGPGFEKHEFLEYRLRKTDAKEIVDVIHTDGYDSFFDPADWISPVNHYGTLIPLGTVDFYPNYGYDQPGAGATSLTIAGSHTRAIDLYIWSIGNPQKFVTDKALDGTPAFETPVKSVKKIDDPAEMGYHAPKAASSTGLYYVETNKSSPWVSLPGEDADADGHSYCIIS